MPASTAALSSSTAALFTGVLVADFVAVSSKELTVATGTKVAIDYSSDGWTFLRTADGRSGHVPTSFVQLEREPAARGAGGGDAAR